jgi:phospholipid/cholesterol/gamma-HCH transport system substrate-binding protein
MVLIAAATGGYILGHENLKLPSWVPVLGREYFTLKGDFQTSQAVIPGQGQAVTIAGAKIGEIASVNLNQGVAEVTMKVTPRYARFYRNATMLLRPKTGLQDMTVEVNPGTPDAGHLRSGETIPLSQTAPNVNFDEFLSALDAETRAYLQELLAGFGQGVRNNGKALSATLKRFDPTARYVQEIASQLEIRHANTARSIHNFRLLTEALGSKDKQLAELVDSSNAVFKTFAAEDRDLERTLGLLPGALKKTESGLGKLAVATGVLGPTLHKLQPFANSLAPANRATINLANQTTPVLKNEIRPFARQILPVINQLQPATQELGESFPKLRVSFAVITEFFNELAYNPGPSKGGFVFFLDWANHDLNSVVSSADAHGPLGRSVIYFNCQVLEILQGVQEVNPTVNLLINLLKPPTKAECQSEGLGAGGAGAKLARARAASRSTGASATSAGVFSGLGANAFAGGAAASGGGGR